MTGLHPILGFAPLTLVGAAAMTFGAAYVRGLTGFGMAIILVPLLGLTLVDLRLIAGNKDEHGRMAVHASFVALFLIVGHVAMVFGMLDPSVLMGEPAAPTHAH